MSKLFSSTYIGSVLSPAAPLSLLSFYIALVPHHVAGSCRSSYLTNLCCPVLQQVSFLRVHHLKNDVIFRNIICNGCKHLTFLVQVVHAGVWDFHMPLLLSLKIEGIYIDFMLCKYIIWKHKCLILRGGPAAQFFKLPWVFSPVSDDNCSDYSAAVLHLTATKTPWVTGKWFPHSLVSSLYYLCALSLSWKRN